MYYFSSILHSLLPFKRLFIGILNPYYKYILYLQRTLTDLALIPIFISMCFQNTENYPICAQRSHPPSTFPIEHHNHTSDTVCVVVVFYWKCLSRVSIRFILYMLYTFCYILSRTHTQRDKRILF